MVPDYWMDLQESTKANFGPSVVRLTLDFAENMCSYSVCSAICGRNEPLVIPVLFIYFFVFNNLCMFVN